MEIKELKKDNIEFHAGIIVPAKVITDQINSELKKAAKTAKMDGFRVGKVPVHMLKKRYEPSIRMDVVRQSVNDAIDEVIKKNELNIATDPAIEDLKSEADKDLEFTLKFELLPDIELPDFSKISIEKPILEVEEKDIDEQIKRMADFSKSFDKESKAKSAKGDQVTIDAVGYVDGEAFEGGKLDDHRLILGSGAFIPGFEDQLIGVKAGEDVLVKVDFPKDYHADDLAGKPSEFKVQVKAVHKPKTPKIDDEFAKKFKCETLEELKGKIKENIASMYDEPIHVNMKMDLFDKLEKELKFDVPKSLIDREVGILKSQTQESGLNDEEIEGKTEEEKEAYFNKLALRRVRIGLALAEYVKKKSLQISEDDVRQAIMEQARNYPGQEREVFEFFQKDPRAIESLKGPIMEEKGVTEIFANEVKLKEKSYNKKALEKMLKQD